MRECRAAVLGEAARGAAGSGSTAPWGRQEDKSDHTGTGVSEERSEAGSAEAEPERQWGPKDTGLKQTAGGEALGEGDTRRARGGWDQGVSRRGN